MQVKAGTSWAVRRTKNGFTLVELLVVIGVISLLLATLLPALAAAKRRAWSVTCQAQLRNIAIAWKSYLMENDDYFYQGRNANHNYGGWKGEGGYGATRPLNRYIGLTPALEKQEGAEKFACPADSGGVFGQPPEQIAFNYFGNSYQTNIFLIGPDRIGVPPGKYQALHRGINARLKRLRSEGVDDPGHLVLVGDNNWVSEWHPFYPKFILPEMRYWHGLEAHYNLAFLDGRVSLIEVEKGVYVQENIYRVMPFSELDQLAFEAQK